MVGRISLNGNKPKGKKKPKEAEKQLTVLVQPGKLSKFRPEYVRMAREVCILGATNPELAKVLGVNADTIHEWRIRYPDFEEATRVGKAEADERVTRALFHRAVGYQLQTERLFLIEEEREELDKNGAVIATITTKKVLHEPVIEHVQPDTTACIFWLKNRRPEQWREKATFEHTGASEGPITVENAREVLFDRVLSVAARLRETRVITQQESK